MYYTKISLCVFLCDFSLKKVRSEGPTIYLNAGDTFQGTSWYSLFKGKLAGELLNILSPDAVVI